MNCSSNHHGQRSSSEEFTPAIVGMKMLLYFPLHDGAGEPLENEPLLFCSTAAAPFLEKVLVSMPGECCTVKGIGGDDDKNDASLSTVVEDSETNKAPKVLSPAVTSQVAGMPGAKNVAPTAGLTD